MALPEGPFLFVELRDDQRRSVRFSAFCYAPFAPLWENIGYSERWWISLLTATGSVVLFQQYIDGQPDRKKILAADYTTGRIVWEKDDFSFRGITDGLITGTIGLENPAPVALDPSSGDESDKKIAPATEISSPLRPFQYYTDTPHFRTVQTFLQNTYQQEIEGLVEYVEFSDVIVVSYYGQHDGGLTNYLLVVNNEGKELLHEKMDEGLKGLGTDTFFILAGCLFFVRNKRELLSYHIS